MSRKKVKIFGERNTSTNAIKKSIIDNFDVEILPSNPIDFDKKYKKIIEKIEANYEKPRSIILKEGFLDSLFESFQNGNSQWKHSFVSADSIFNFDKVFFIFTSRHPVSWLLALQKRPYHKLQDINKDFSGFVAQPWKTLRREGLEQKTITPLQLWNIKMRGYMECYEEIVSSGGAASIVRFEDFAISQKNALKEFVELMGSDGSDFVPYEKSTKDKGKSSSFYKEYYGKQLWKNEVSSRDWILS